MAAVQLDEVFSEANAGLSSFPLSGPVGIVSGTRELVSRESYRLVYEIDEDQGTLWVLALCTQLAGGPQ